jgi:hypothetical protein
MRLESLVTNLIGTDCHSTKLSQETGNGALAAADASGETNNYHSRLSHLFCQQRLEISSEPAWVDVSVARRYHSEIGWPSNLIDDKRRKDIKL